MRKIILAFLLMLSANTNASFDTGNDLLMACDEGTSTSIESAMSKVLCVGYISGMVDSIQVLFGRYPEIAFFCLPEHGMSGNQKVLIVQKYLEANPNRLHESARISVFVALAKAFPC